MTRQLVQLAAFQIVFLAACSLSFIGAVHVALALGL